jgi:hypothetical protein
MYKSAPIATMPKAQGPIRKIVCVGIELVNVKVPIHTSNCTIKAAIIQYCALRYDLTTIESYKSQNVSHSSSEIPCAGGICRLMGCPGTIEILVKVMVYKYEKKEDLLLL